MTKFLNISTDTTLGGDSPSDEILSSQKAVKSYVDSQTGTAPSFANITGQPTDNTNLATALNAKYDASNPNGYTNNVGTVTSVNSVSPVNGNVTLSIPTVSDTYSATSSDAMSGKAVASAVSGYVPTSRTVNGKALSSNISLSASDVGALPDSTVIPTVNNATLTIQKNGTTVKTFTANASTDVTANITVPTKVSDLTNDSGFITGITSSDVTTALGYTPYDSSNPSGYTSNVGTVTSVNNVSPTNGNVSLSIPTVNNATLTITQGGTTKGTFTANASSNVTIDLDSGGGSGSSRNVGEIIQSTIPLTDAGLHLLDGSVISGNGAYSAFVTHIAGLYRETETSWIQPILTSNGTLGGNRFAVYASNNYDASTYPIYKSFDNDDATIWYCSSAPVDVIIYNPQPLKITKIQCKNRSDAANYTFTAGTVYGSNDGSSWTQLNTFTNDVATAGGTYDISLSGNTNFYIYYKITFSSASTTGVGANFAITATYLDIPSMFTTEANWQTSVTNYGACDKFVYDSVNNTVRLPKRVTDHGELIKSYSSGTDWYRIYSDGWCEQGGMTDIIADYGTATVDLLKPFLNTNYTITKATMMPSTGDDGQWNEDTCIRYATRTNSSFQVYSRGAVDNGRYVNWQVCGYIDISDLQQTPVYEYIVIANSVKTPVEVDIDEVMTDLNDKVDKSDLAPVQCVIETYSSGADWYRVWSDGWIEQGGIIEQLSDKWTIIFLKPFANSNYNLQGEQWGTDASGNLGINTQTATSASGNHIGSGTMKVTWYACGY